MSRKFEEMRTERGMQEWEELIGHTARELDLAIESHGAHGIEAAHEHLVLGLLHYQIGDFEGAEPHIWNYVTLSQQRYGSKSDELLTGLILLSNNCIGRGWWDESQSVFDRLKFVRQRSPWLCDPLLERLYNRAVECKESNEPTSQQRGFIFSLMALSWCVRHQSDTQIYEQFIPRLETLFESYGFAGFRWEWILKQSNHNRYDILGLLSLLLDRRILPPDAQTEAEIREGLNILIEEYPVSAERDLRELIATSGGQPVKLQFKCPMCSSWDLRTMFLEPYHPVSTLDRIKVDPKDIDLCDLEERDPSEFVPEGHSEGWEFWCDKCALSPYLEPFDEDETQVESLARWLLDNCPQDLVPQATKD